MWIWRNREIKRFLLIQGLLSIAGVIVVGFFSPTGAVVAAILTAALIGSAAFFNLWRYRELDRLSHYLMRISNGDYSLDVRDNDEGELSILKSEIYKVTVTLREQAETLKADKLEMSKALSDISHQLKTPLTSIFMMTDLLCDGNLPVERQAEFAGKIRSQLERTQWLVTALLKLSKLDAGTITFREDEVPVQLLIKKASEPLLILMELKHQDFCLHLGEGLNLKCDLNWTAEAVSNILKNCVEHTPEYGKVQIFCSANPLYTELIIADNGSGIERTDLPYVFKRFYKGRNAGDESVGIGLSMAKTIVNAQGGSLDVKSTKGEGTCFSIKFFK